MANPETTKKTDPPVELPKCLYATEAPTPDEYGSIINITVGEGATERRFQVYEGLLKHYSGYFRAALSERWLEAGLKTIDLPEDDPKVFSAFFNWLSASKLYSRLAPDGMIPIEFDIISKTYVFGDARGIPELCNAAMDLFFQKVSQDWLFPYGCLNYIYTNTSQQSLLRRYIVDEGFEAYSFKDLKDDQDHYPKEFLIDIVEQAMQRNTPMGFGTTTGRGKYIHTKKLEICGKYHDHSASNTSALS